MTHTPWEALDSHVSQRQKLLYSSGSSVPFATLTFVTNVLSKGVSQKDIKAITEFIVLAVNCHDELLGVIRDTLGFLLETFPYEYSEQKDKLSAIIAKAT